MWACSSGQTPRAVQLSSSTLFFFTEVRSDVARSIQCFEVGLGQVFDAINLVKSSQALFGFGQCHERIGDRLLVFVREVTANGNTVVGDGLGVPEDDDFFADGFFFFVDVLTCVVVADANFDFTVEHVQHGVRVTTGKLRINIGERIQAGDLLQLGGWVVVAGGRAFV